MRMNDSMIRRSGGMPKIIGAVLVFFALVYMTYLYNDTAGQLKNTERTAERYRREQESVSAQLQELKASADDTKRRCENDQEQMNNRLSSLNQQYKMLKSQHEDMESEFGRLQSEKEKEAEDHKRLDEERTLEYNQFKQEKLLEISSLKDTVANYEREKEQLNEEVNKLKTQLQQSLMELEANKQSLAAYRYQLNQAQNQLQQQQQPMNVGQQQGVAGNQQFGLQGNQQQGMMGGQGAGLQQGLQQGLNQGLQQNQGLPQNQGFIQGGNNQNHLDQQQQGLLQGNANIGNVKPINGEGMNIADEILKSLQDKHKPVDNDLLEEQQKQHQIIPPGDHDQDRVDLGHEKQDLGNEKHGQNMIGQDGHNMGQHQILRPDLQAGADQQGEDNEGAGDGREENGGHDNRIENQGPVNLQVQEPVLKQGGVDSEQAANNNLMFHPNVPDAVDNQMQPNMPVDDSIKQEQMEVPVRPMAPQGADIGEEKLGPMDEDDDDQKYDDDYDKDINDDKDDEYKR